MPRDLPVSNGNLLVNFDLDYHIRDIYFPRIGQENHTRGEQFRFGIWADGQLSWMGPDWEKVLRYRDDSLVTDVCLTNATLGLEVRCQDAIDVQLDVYLRRVEVTDLLGKERDVRLFFLHDFHLYGQAVGDTAFFDPRSSSVIHYKVNRYFLARCRTAESAVPDYYSCGRKASPAISSEIESGGSIGSPIAWGATESYVGARLSVPAGGSAVAHYWLAAGRRYADVAALNDLVLAHTPDALIERTSSYWRAWARKEVRTFGDLPSEVCDVYNRSLLILRSQIDNRGAIIAANDSDIVRFGGDTYSYMWGRDGAFVAAALCRAGYSELCRPFFDFCKRVLAEPGYLLQHYNPDGSVASNWHSWLVDGEEVLPIQEDSTALLLWALWLYYECSKDLEFIRPLYETFVLRCADFLTSYRDPQTGLPEPSYDLWEERFGVHMFTVSAVIAGLRAAAKFAGVFQDAGRVKAYESVANEMAAGLSACLFDEQQQRYARSGYRRPDGYELDRVIDVSLLGLVTLETFPPGDPRVAATVEAVRQQLGLQTPIGGVARYTDDNYQREEDVPRDVPGNPWFIATLWVADTIIAGAQTLEQLHDAVPYLQWCVRNALPSGVLAEQVHPLTGAPLSVSPLTWSHSAFVWTVLAYVDKYQSFCGGTAAGTDMALPAEPSEPLKVGAQSRD